MKNCSFDSYKGNDSYIFASYSHLDSDDVYPIIEKLNEQGFRVWYDGGIEPGKRWGKEISRRIAGCEVFLSFVSRNYINSDNCINELYFACDKKKKGFVIYIDDEKVPDEISLMISSVQGIYKSKYETDDKFFEAVCDASELDKCNENPRGIEESSRLFKKTKLFSGNKKLKKKIALIIAVITVLLASVYIYNGYYHYGEYELLTLQTIGENKNLSELMDYCVEICKENNSTCNVLVNGYGKNHICFTFTSENNEDYKKAANAMAEKIKQEKSNSQTLITDSPQYKYTVVCIDISVDCYGYVYVFPDGSVGDNS
jgi:hypothetical protein